MGALQGCSLGHFPTHRGLSTCLAGNVPRRSPYLSVQLFNQGYVSKIGVNRKDTSSAGVKADVVGDGVSLGVCSIQGVHMRAWKETAEHSLLAPSRAGCFLLFFFILHDYQMAVSTCHFTDCSLEYRLQRASGLLGLPLGSLPGNDSCPRNQDWGCGMREKGGALRWRGDPRAALFPMLGLFREF